MDFCCPSSANGEDLELNEKLSALEEAKGTGGVKVDSNKVSGRQNGAFKNLGLPHMVALLLCLVLIGGLLYGTFGGGGGGGTSGQLKPKQHATGSDGTDRKYSQSPNLRGGFVPKIVKAIFSQSAGKSNVFCPAGVVMLLEMVTPAFAEGSDARKELTEVLGNPYPLKEIQDFTEVIKVGNLFAARGTVAPTGDLKAYLKNHNADFGLLTKAAVNNFVSEKTEGMINTLLDDEPDMDIKAMLVNTILVQDSYQGKFEDSDESFEFMTCNGKQLQLGAPKLMQGKMMYYEGNGYQAFVKFGKHKSAQGKTTNVVIILPDSEGVPVADPNAWIKDRLDNEWNTIAEGLNLSNNGKNIDRKDVRLPMFKVEGDHDVKPALISIGLDKMFTQNVANVQASAKLTIAAVKQKAVA
eukprot:367879_1